MKKDDLVLLVKQKGQYKSKEEAERALRSCLDAIQEALFLKEDVSIHGFGTFKPVRRPEKTGKVPGKPNQTYTTPATTVVKFIPAKNLKDAVAGQ